MSDLQRRIEYIIESDGDTDEKAARIAGMLERKDRHIAKLAEVGMTQEKEIADLQRRVEALEARPVLQPIMTPPMMPWPWGPAFPTYPIITCEAQP